MDDLRKKVHGHEVEGDPLEIKVLAMDHADDSGASHHYRFERGSDGSLIGDLQFHVGEIEIFHGKDANGVTMESVISAMIDRLKGFQKGTAAHKQYDLARKRLDEALTALKLKTEEELKAKEQPVA